MSLLELSVRQGTAYKVAMNEFKFLRFGDNGITSIGTANLNGCSAVMVLSAFGAILGHIAPLPDDHSDRSTAGDDHARSKMDLLRSLYTANKRYFPTGSNGWVFCAIFEGEVGLPDQQKIFQDSLVNLGLPYSFRTYTAAATRHRRGTTAGQGTVFIQSNGKNPLVYIEDVDVTPQESHGENTSEYTVQYSSTPGGTSFGYTTQYSLTSEGNSLTSAGSSTIASQSSIDDTSTQAPYYFVRGKIYYYFANGKNTPLSERPKNVWVFNENGWSESIEGQKWRIWDGRSVSYS